MRLHRFAVAFATLAVTATLAHAGDPAWSVKLGEIQFQKVSSLGSLIVSHSKGLTALDPATGKVIWERPDLVKFKECNFDEIENTPYALLDGKQFEVIDLETGKPKWDSSKLPFRNSQGQFQVAHKRLLVVFGTVKAGQKPTLVAVDTETGQIKWQQDKLFDKYLLLHEVKGSGKVFKRMSVAANQPPAFPDENSMVLWVTEDGPVCIDLETGAKKWTCAGLKGKTPAALAYGFCPMFAKDGVIYIPYEKSLQAIDAATGALLWAKEKDFRGRPVQIAMASAGVVVRGAPFVKEDGKPAGKPFIDCLNPKTGESVWPKPFKDLEDATSFDMKGDHLYICADGEMHQVALTNGTDQILARFKFKEHEVPSDLELLEDGSMLLTSSQTILRLDASGKETARAYFEAPSTSGWAKLGAGLLTAAVNAAAAGSAYDRAQRTGMDQTYYLSSNPLLGKRFRASTQSATSLYVLTMVPGSDGHKVSGIARVERLTGKVLSTAALNEKTPVYEVDEVENMLYFIENDDIVEAYRM